MNTVHALWDVLSDAVSDLDCDQLRNGPKNNTCYEREDRETGCVGCRALFFFDTARRLYEQASAKAPCPECGKEKKDG